MNYEFLGYTIGTVGKLMVAYTAIMVHYRVRKEHKIDDKVFKVMRFEHAFGIAGILFMIVGYLMEIPGRFL